MDNSTAQSRAVTAVFQIAKDAVLEAREWLFAKDWVQLALDATQPIASAYDNRFIIPSTISRVLRCWDANQCQVEPFERNGAYILASVTALYAEVIRRDVISTNYPGAFGLALAAKVAALIAVPMTENRQLRVDMEQLFDKYIKEASFNDGSQATSHPITVPKLPGRVR
jgi:hypothetical protein